VSSAPDDESPESPRYGDRVEHFAFGLCDVMVVREGRMKIRPVGGGNLKEIQVSAVRVMKPSERDGKRVFVLARRG
jgi:hypothetical protein